MSRAFVREDAGERWTAPAAPQEYRILYGLDVVHETDDLLEAIRWLENRPVSGFAVRAKDGGLIAVA